MSTASSTATSRQRRPFDSWLHRGPFVARDLAIFRIICGVLLLATQERFQWIDGIPNSFYDPPPGPFQLLTGFPQGGFFAILGIALVVTTFAMTIGIATRWSSIAVTLLLITGYGFEYSFGKVEHSILIAIAPAILSFSNWGAQLSVDSLLRRSAAPPIRQWALRAFAIAIGVSFSTAAYVKIASGWLSSKTQVAQTYFLQAQDSGGSRNFVTQFALSTHGAGLWESVDWATIAFEVLMSIAFISWRLLRVAVAIATLFHLSIYFLLGIQFDWNVIAYGAFVSWNIVPLPHLAATARRVLMIVGLVALAALALTTGYWVAGPFNHDAPDFAVPILYVGAIIGAGYLVWLVVRGIRRPMVLAPIVPPGTGVRILAIVAAIVLVLASPAGLFIKHAKGEPYPALFQPGFDAPGPQAQGRIIAQSVHIEVTLSNGSVHKLMTSQAIPHTGLQGTVFQDGFHRPSADISPETKAWLAAWLDAQFAPLRATRMTAIWENVKYNRQTGAITYKSIGQTTTVILNSDG